MPAEATRSTRAQRCRWLTMVSAATGATSIVLGLGLAVFGLGFATTSATGTGMAIAVAGVWSLAAMRGIWHGRRSTALFLLLAWAIVLVRLAVDFPSSSSSLVLALFLLPALTIPVGLLWILSAGTLVTGLLVRVARRADQTGREPGKHAYRLVTPTIALLVLLAAMFGTPHLVGMDRASKISRLEPRYRSMAETNSAPRPRLGACTMTFLGYSLTERGDSKKPGERRNRAFELSLGDAIAEIHSIAAARAEYIRAGASGDQFIVSKPDQERIDDAFVEAIRATGRKLVLVDTQHPKFAQKRKLSWAEFCAFHERRIMYYQRRYQPAVYQLVCEPMSYHDFVINRESPYSAELWAQQLASMCRRVKSLAPETRTAICLLVAPEKKPEWLVWEKLRELPELDILCVEIYQPEDFARTLERLGEHGHPVKYGKQFWVAETYNGWAMGPGRRWDLDARWVTLAHDFGKAAGAEAVMVWTFGTFAEGGSFWDFMLAGAYARRWQERGLSVIGKEFQRLAEPAQSGDAPVR